LSHGVNLAFWTEMNSYSADTSTPPKPTPPAHQRAASALSFKMKTDRAVINIGAMKKIEYASVQPILAAMDVMAAHCDSYSLPASWTMRTARSITSGEYRTDFFMVVMVRQCPVRYYCLTSSAWGALGYGCWQELATTQFA
jgi:hypothetical protein